MTMAVSNVVAMRRRYSTAEPLPPADPDGSHRGYLAATAELNRCKAGLGHLETVADTTADTSGTYRIGGGA